MGVFDVVSLAILAILLVGGLFLILIVAAIPGVLAKKRHSPWAEAINVAGWIGVLLPPIWMLALIAAFVRPQVGEGAQIAISQDETTELAAAIAKISIAQTWIAGSGPRWLPIADSRQRYHQMRLSTRTCIYPLLISGFLAAPVASDSCAAFGTVNNAD